MGFFNLFGTKRGKQLTASAFTQNELVVLHDENVIVLGSNIQVDNGQIAVFMVGDTITDIFPEGNHRIVAENIPLTVAKMPRLFYAKDPKKRKKQIKVDIYFVKVVPHQIKNITTGTVVLRNQKGAKIRSNLKFNVTFTVKDVREFIGAIKTFYGIIRPRIANRTMSGLISDDIAKLANKQKLSAEEMKQKPDVFLSEENTKKLAATLIDYGIHLNEIKIEEVIIPKRWLSNIIFADRIKESMGNFAKLTNEKPNEIILEKVGTDSFLDKALPVDVISGNKRKSEMAILNVNTGQDADKEVVFQLDADDNLPKSEYNKNMEEMLIKVGGGRDEEEKRMESRVPENTKEFVDSAVNNMRPQKYCRQCGTKLDSGDIYCGNCGKRA